MLKELFLFTLPIITFTYGTFLYKIYWICLCTVKLTTQKTQNPLVSIIMLNCTAQKHPISEVLLQYIFSLMIHTLQKKYITRDSVNGIFCNDRFLYRPHESSFLFYLPLSLKTSTKSKRESKSI